MTVENVQSSANKINLKLVIELGKSLIYVRKRRGPNIDSWGTPQFVIIKESI